VLLKTHRLSIWCGQLSATLAAVLLCVPGLSAAQTAVVAPRCAQLLTIEQIQATIGSRLVATAQASRDPKVLECVWSRAGGATVSMQFFDRKAIEANPVTRTPDGYFEMIVSAGEETVSKKREPVAGMNSRAAFVQGQTQLMLVVHRSDGVARLLLGNVTRPQATALAKALAGN